MGIWKEIGSLKGEMMKDVIKMLINCFPNVIQFSVNSKTPKVFWKLCI